MKTLVLTTMTVGSLLCLASCGSGSGAKADVMIQEPAESVVDQGKKKGK